MSLVITPTPSGVTSVSATSPVVSTGGPSPNISMSQANSTTNGYLTSTDWTTFNNKAPAFTYTSNYIPYGQGTTTPTQSANLTFNGSGFTLGGGATNYIFNSYGIGTTVTGAFYSDQSQAWVMLKDSGTTLGHVRLGSESGDMVFWANNTEAGRWKNGNLVISTSGKGIDFSATAGTGTSELLADYEEGTWTPTQGAGLTVVGTFSSAGYYTKVGRLVTVNGYVAGTTSVAFTGGTVVCGGLPYTAQIYNVGSCRNAGYTAFRGVATAFSNANLYGVEDMAATTSIAFSITYWV